MRRRHLGGMVNDESYDGWHHYARIHGVSVAALLEVTGQWLGEQNGRLEDPWAGIVERARDLTSRRRLRG